MTTQAWGAHAADQPLQALTIHRREVGAPVTFTGRVAGSR